jgi:hypothetical protein
MHILRLTTALLSLHFAALPCLSVEISDCDRPSDAFSLTRAAQSSRFDGCAAGVTQTQDIASV